MNFAFHYLLHSCAACFCMLLPLCEDECRYSANESHTFLRNHLLTCFDDHLQYSSCKIVPSSLVPEVPSIRYGIVFLDPVLVRPRSDYASAPILYFDSLLFDFAKFQSFCVTDHCNLLTIPVTTNDFFILQFILRIFFVIFLNVYVIILMRSDFVYFPIPFCALIRLIPVMNFLISEDRYAQREASDVMIHDILTFMFFTMRIRVSICNP